MKLLLVVCLLAAACEAAKLDALSARAIGVVRDDSVAPLGAVYRTSFQTDNGIHVEEEGAPGAVGQANVKGSYSYTSPEGELITITYVADENGYRAEGPYIHPIPPHALAQLRAAEALRRQ